MSLHVIRRLLWLVLAIATLLAVPVQADTIFSNLGPFISDGDPRTAKPGYDQFVGACGIFASLGSSSCGVEFTSPGDFVLTQVEVALFRGIGHFEPDPLFLSVRADANGLPGATLVTLSVGVEGSFGLAPRPEVVTSAHGPLLLAGEEYWLVLSTTDTADSDVINGEDLAIWDANSTGGVGPLVSISPSGIQLSLGTQPAFQVDGTLATPEPATLGMLGSGLAMMTWWIRRKVRKNF